MISKTPWLFNGDCVVDSDGDEVAAIWNADDGPIIAAAHEAIAACRLILKARELAARATVRALPGMGDAAGDRGKAQSALAAAHAAAERAVEKASGE